MDVFALCTFQTPLEGAADGLETILRAGMPVNIKVGDLREDSDLDAQAGLLHLICTYATSPEQLEVAESMIDTLFEYGASWMLLDGHNKTPGDIAYELGKKTLYGKFVHAGARSEIVLQKLLEDDDDEADDEPVNSDGAAEGAAEGAAGGAAEGTTAGSAEGTASASPEQAVEGNNTKFLANKLQYNDHTLETDEQDGVMMDWETPIMKRSAEIITKPQGSVLNIGFGMGIIDGFIQELGPKTHYIVEAHPVVLAQMRKTGWFDKPNVRVLEGTWKTVLPDLIEQGVLLDGIYYDTFSEHYKDMLQLFDMVVGLLNFDGKFSYFNGLGADRQVCYDVYKQVATYNLKDYGLQLEFENMPVSIPESAWSSIKREYFKLSEYALPIVTFTGNLEEEEGDLVQM